MTGSAPEGEREPLNILSIGAHPADVFDQSGGTMAHHAARGDRVTAVVLTAGARAHDEVLSDQLFNATEMPKEEEFERLIEERIEVKEAELRRACDLLGVHDVRVMRWNQYEVFLLEKQHILELAHLIREVRPDIVLTQHPYEQDGLKEHAIAGQTVIHAIRQAIYAAPGESLPPHKVAQVFFFGPGAAPIPNSLWEAGRPYYNDVFVDITDVIDKKLAALDCLHSQGYSGSYARARIEFTDGAFGNSGGKVPYAEGFVKMFAETHYFLPVTDHAMETARLSDHKVTARGARRAHLE